MSSARTCTGQLRDILEFLLVFAGVVIGGVIIAILIGDWIGRISSTSLWETGPKSKKVFNVRIPDIVWVSLFIFTIGMLIKILISFLLTIVLPFHVYCPHCGVKPLPAEEYCAECTASLFRNRLSPFDMKLLFLAPLGMLIFVLI